MQVLSFPTWKSSAARASLAAALVLFADCAFAQPLQMRVAPTAQSAASPAAISLGDALAKVEALSTGTWPKDGVVVRLQAGTYRLESPMRLGPRLSGRVTAPLVFEGPAGGLAVLSGARPVSGFAPVTDAKIQSRLSEGARLGVLQANLRLQGIDDFGRFTRQGQGRQIEAAPLELYYRGRPMQLAQWPNLGYAQLESAEPNSGATVVKLPKGQFAAWAVEPELWMAGYWGEDWADEWIPIAKVDPAARTLQLGGGPPLYGAKPGQRVKVVNALSELDSPGEWYLDRTSGILYFWPPQALAQGDVEVSLLPHALQVDGASHVHFVGVSFEGVRSDAIVVNGGRDVRIERARIRNAGNRAVVMNGVAHAVVDSDIHDTGQGGVILSGGDRKTLLPAGLTAQGNRIQRFNRWVKTYRPAISLAGVGNTARGNLVFDGSHAGLLFFGNDHLIENNEFYGLAQESGDVGAIYTGRDWTARGTVIRFNYLHDIHGPGKHGAMGIYLDDQASGITIQGNLFVRVGRAVFIGGGRDNIVDNNLFVDSRPAIHLDARGRTWQKAQTDDPNGQLRKTLRELPYQKSPYVDRYPALAKLLEDAPGSPRGNVIRRNAIIGDRTLELVDGTEKEVEVDRLFGEKDFIFSGSITTGQRLQPDAFAPQPGSPALRAGFAALPWRDMGCAARRWDAVPVSGNGLPKLAACN